MFTTVNTAHFQHCQLLGGQNSTYAPTNEIFYSSEQWSLLQNHEPKPPLREPWLWTGRCFLSFALFTCKKTTWCEYVAIHKLLTNSKISSGTAIRLLSRQEVPVNRHRMLQECLRLNHKLQVSVVCYRFLEDAENIDDTYEVLLDIRIKSNKNMPVA